MAEFRIQKFTLIRLIYGIIIIIVLISAFLPYFSRSYVYPPPPAEPIYNYTKNYIGYLELIYGGWIGIALLIISVVILNPERKSKALLIGIGGCILILINLMIRPSLQNITLSSGFYIGLIFGIGLIAINLFAFISKEGVLTFDRVKSAKVKEVKVKPVKIKPVKVQKVKSKPVKTRPSKVKVDKRKAVEVEPIAVKQEAVVGTDWESKEFIEEKTKDFIKTMQFKSKELPFFEIISKTGVNRGALETIVDDMITNKVIDARVRDFVIIFREISKEKREEGLKKVKSGLQQQLSNIDELIQGNRFDEAIASLNSVIESAEEFSLAEIIEKAKDKIDMCNKLKIEKSEELDEQRVKDELRIQLSEIEDLIDDNKFKVAHRDIERVKEIAEEYNLTEFVNKAEELTNQCNELETDLKKDMEEQRVKSELQQNMLTITKQINQKKFDVAIKNLEQVIKDAETYEFEEYVKEAEEKIKISKELEIEWRREQKQKAKEDLRTKMTEINVLIKEGKFKGANRQLDKVKEVAQEFKLSEFLNEADEKIKECQALELEIRKDKDQIKTGKKLQKQLSNIEKLIETNKFYDAILNLVDMKEVARQYELSDILEKIEEKIEFCKNFQFNTKKKVKDTILDYGAKLARLELMDIIEKSGIQDETLIEQIIFEMIKNREINGEYFSSSKSIAFYQQTKEAVPVSEIEEITKQKVFLSYSTLDAERFRISDIVKELEVYPEIQKVTYWQADSNQNIVEFMEDTLKNTDVFILFCSKNSVKSDAVKGEWQAAYQMRKKGMLKMIPVYEIEEEIPVLLWQMLNVKFTEDNFEGFIEKLYEEILRGLRKPVSPTA